MSNEKELEAVLMEYIARYGLTERARAYFAEKGDSANKKATATTEKMSTTQIW